MRVQGVTLVGLSGFLVVVAACKPESKGPAVESPRGERAAEFSTFADATWADFQESLGTGFEFTGDDFQQQSTQTIGPCTLQLAVRRQPNGRINFVRCQIACPADTPPDVLEQQGRQTMSDLARALKLPTGDVLQAKSQIALTLANVEKPHSFYNGLSLFSIRPDAGTATAASPASSPGPEPAPKAGGGRKQAARKQAPGKEAGGSASGAAAGATKAPRSDSEPSGAGPRGPAMREIALNVTPLVKVEQSAYRALPGSSLEQLEKLLEGFSAPIRAGQEEALYQRQAENHREIVHCKLTEQGNICWLEAFVCDAPSDTNRLELNLPLWLRLADLQYEGSAPAEIKAFLEAGDFSYDTAYEMGTGKTIGAATFYLSQYQGAIGQMLIWGEIQRPGSRGQDDAEPASEPE